MNLSPFWSLLELQTHHCSHIPHPQPPSVALLKFTIHKLTRPQKIIHGLPQLLKRCASASIRKNATTLIYCSKHFQSSSATAVLSEVEMAGILCQIPDWIKKLHLSWVPCWKAVVCIKYPSHQNALLTNHKVYFMLILNLVLRDAGPCCLKPYGKFGK